MSHWYLRPILGSYLVVAVIAAALILLVALGPKYRDLPRGRRWVLIAFRVAVILLLAVAMLRPRWESTTTRPLTATVVLMSDATRSMNAAAEAKSRWEEQVAALRGAEPELAALADELEVKVYLFDTEANPAALDGGAIELPDAPTGDLTDYGSSLDDAIRRERGKRLAAVVLMGDGSQRTYQPRVEMEQAARELAELQCPLHTICFGLARDASQSRDIAVENMLDHYEVSVKNQLVIEAALRVQGYVNKPIPVDLIVEDSGGNKETVTSALLTASQDGEQLRIEMNYVPKRPGQYKVTIKAQKQPGELVTKNNELTAFLTVRAGGLRVLYIEGSLRNEQKFIRRAINQSGHIDLDFVYIDPRTRQPNAWPVDLVKVIRENEYDVFILGDVDSEALGKLNLDPLAEAVAEGKGLIALGGYHAFGPGGYGSTVLADVLPVTLDRIRQNFNNVIIEELHLPGPLQAVPTSDDYLVRLAAGDENLTTWQKLPALTGANKFAGRKGRSRVRLQTPEGVPLLVSGEYEQGRVLAFAGDSTWQWALHSDESQLHHRRFWRQIIYWLARKTEEQDVWIKLDQRRFHPGARVTFTTGIESSTGEPVTDAVLEARVLLEDGAAIPITLTAGDGRFRGMFDQTKRLGDYTIEVVAKRNGVEFATAQTKFLVFDVDLEMTNPVAQPEQLARLSKITEEFGGQLWGAEQLPSLLKSIREQPPKMEIEVQTKWELGDTWLDAWLYFLTIVTLLTGEWICRKGWGLV